MQVFPTGEGEFAYRCYPRPQQSPLHQSRLTLEGRAPVRHSGGCRNPGNLSFRLLSLCRFNRKGNEKPQYPHPNRFWIPAYAGMTALWFCFDGCEKDAFRRGNSLWKSFARTGGRPQGVAPTANGGKSILVRRGEPPCSPVNFRQTPQRVEPHRLPQGRTLV